jgi:hypothetical protein
VSNHHDWNPILSPLPPPQLTNMSDFKSARTNTVFSQPTSKGMMDPYPTDDKHPLAHDEHNHTMNHRCSRPLCRVLPIAFLISLMVLAMFAASSCSEMFGMGGGGIAKRAVTQGNSALVDRKCVSARCHLWLVPKLTDESDYLIIVLVGLLIVVVLAVCLSAWCCKGTFLLSSFLLPPFSKRQPSKSRRVPEPALLPLLPLRLLRRSRYAHLNHLKPNQSQSHIYSAS